MFSHSYAVAAPAPPSKRVETLILLEREKEKCCLVAGNEDELTNYNPLRKEVKGDFGRGKELPELQFEEFTFDFSMSRGVNRD